MSASDPYYWISNLYLEGPGLYVIEFSDDEAVGENLEDMFPGADLSDKSERDEAFEEYADLLVASQEYIPIPKRLC